MSNSLQMPVVEVRNLCKYYNRRDGKLRRGGSMPVKACDDLSFSIGEGETFGLVGESGCGKTTTGRTLLRLMEPTAGEIFYRGKNITGAHREEMKRLRRKMQIIFQNPYTSLDPNMNVAQLIGEGLVAQKLFKKGSDALRDRVYQLMEMCGLRGDMAQQYVRELSGGQRQRICIARALALEPDFIVCDEPVSALDVSIQAQIINLLISLKETLGISYLFISHDLSVVRHISERIGVMKAGRLVEVAETEELFRNPQHPYTKMLLSSILPPDPDKRVPLSAESLGRVETQFQRGELIQHSAGHWVAQEI